MGLQIEDEIKRCTVKRKSALVIDITHGKCAVAEASRVYNLSASEIENWVDDAKRSVENTLRVNPLVLKEQYAYQIKVLQKVYAEGRSEIC